MAEKKSNKQYFERALLKSLTNFGHSQTSHAFECLLLTAEMFCQLASAKVLFLIAGPTGVVF
jgi:hypothetical protein